MSTEEAEMSTTTSTVRYAVAGLTCDEYIVKGMEHVRRPSDVNAVAVDPTTGGESVRTIKPDPGTSLEKVVAAVGEASVDLTGLTRRWPGAHSVQYPGGMTRPAQVARPLDLLEGVRR